MGRPPSPIKNVRRIFTLSPDDVARLDGLRTALGLKSDAAVLRKLIREAAKKAGLS